MEGKQGEVRKLKSILWINFSICSMFLPPFVLDSYTWDSLGRYTHAAITRDSVKILSSSEYPDLLKYIREIKDGSKTESHNTSPDNIDNNISLNGGFPKAFWDDAIKHYKLFNFSRAYFNIGRVSHLVQDQAVPTHAANIPHGLSLNLRNWHFDKFESAADNHYAHGTVASTSGYFYPDEYYRPLLDSVIKKIENHTWRHPKLGSDYWVVDKSHSGWGKYGGPNNEDNYDYDNSPEIISSQIDEAIAHTAGVLIAASKSLPPLLKNLTIFRKSIRFPSH